MLEYNSNLRLRKLYQHIRKFGKLSCGPRTGRSVFIPIPKKGNAKKCSNYHTIALISHTSKVMLESLQARFARSSKKQESSRKTSFCFIDYAKAFDCVDHNKLWKILKEMGIPNHLTCLLRNLYAGQEATV